MLNKAYFLKICFVCGVLKKPVRLLFDSFFILLFTIDYFCNTNKTFIKCFGLSMYKNRSHKHHNNLMFENINKPICDGRITFSGTQLVA